MNYPTQRRYSSHFIIITTDQLTTTQPCHPPFRPPNLRLSLPKPSPPKPPHTVCTEYISPDTQTACTSANPPSIITALKTLTHTHDSRPLLQFPRWSVHPHLIRRVHHRRECRECLVFGDDLRREGGVWDCCGMYMPNAVSCISNVGLTTQ